MTAGDTISSKSDGNEIALERKIGLARGTSVVVGSMIGSGIFISPTGILRYSGGSIGLSLMIWVICGLLVILAALCLSELGLAFPESGGLNTYLLESFGSGLAFLHSWSFCLVILPGKGAALGLAVGEYVTAPFYPACEAPTVVIQCIAVLVILSVALLNGLSVRNAARLLVVFTAAKVIVLIIISISAFVYLGENSSVAEANFNNAFDLANPVYGTVDQIGVSEVTLALYQGLWPYAGFVNLNFVTEEISNPKKNLPRSIIFGVSLVVLVYVFVNCAYFAVLTPSEILQSRSVASSLADRTITSWSWIVPLGVAISVIGTINAGFFAPGRMAHVAARRGYLPQILSMIQINYLSPIVAVSLLAILDVVFIFPSNIDSLIQGTQFMEWLFIGLSCLGLIVTRFTKKEVERPYKVPLIIPVIVVLASAYLVIAPLVINPDPFVLYASCFTVGGLIFYFPLVYFKLQVPGVDRVTAFMQQFLNVVP